MSEHIVRTNTNSTEAGLLRSWERHLRAENKSLNTIRHYLHTVRNFIRFCEDEHLPVLTEVTREHVELWLEQMHLTMRPHSVRSYSISLRAFFNWLQSEDEIDRHPMVRIK